MTSNPHPHRHDPAEYAARAAAARAWLDRSIGAQQEGEWQPDRLEQVVLADVLGATRPLHGGRQAPHIHDSLQVRVGRISNWAGAIRLAVRAGGWDLVPVVGRDPSAATGPVGLIDLLSALYALAEQGERWQAVLGDALRSCPRSRTVEQAVKEDNPYFERDLADAEAFFTGPGSVEDLELFFY